MNKNCHFVPLILSCRLSQVFNDVAGFFSLFFGVLTFFFICLLVCFFVSFLFLVRDVMFVSLIS